MQKKMIYLMVVLYLCQIEKIVIQKQKNQEQKNQKQKNKKQKHQKQKNQQQKNQNLILCMINLLDQLNT
jgi:fucose permease